MAVRDFDELSIPYRAVAADIETALVIHDLFVAIGFAEFAIRINNRKVLNGLLQKLDLLEQIVTETDLDGLGERIDLMLAHRHKGRSIVRIAG